MNILGSTGGSGGGGVPLAGPVKLPNDYRYVKSEVNTYTKYSKSKS